MRDLGFGSRTCALNGGCDVTQTILVQESDVVISMDMSQTVQEAWSDAEVILCNGPDDVLARLHRADHVTLLILHQSAKSLCQSGIGKLARAKGARVLLTAADEDEAELMATSGWLAVEMPFTARDLLAALCEAAE